MTGSRLPLRPAVAGVPLLVCALLVALVAAPAGGAATKPCPRGKMAMRQLPSGMVSFAGKRGKRICVKIPRVPKTGTSRQLADALTATLPPTRAPSLARREMNASRRALSILLAQALDKLAHASFLWTINPYQHGWMKSTTTETMDPPPGQVGDGKKVTIENRRDDGQMEESTVYEAHAYVTPCPNVSGYVTGEARVRYQYGERWAKSGGWQITTRTALVRLKAPVSEDGTLKPYSYSGSLIIEDNRRGMLAMLIAPNHLYYSTNISAKDVPYYKTDVNDRFAHDIQWRESLMVPSTAEEVRVTSMLMMMQIEAQAGKALKAAEREWLANKTCMKITPNPSPLKLAPGASSTVKLTVTARDGKPIPRAKLTTSATNGAVTPSTLTSDAAGTASIKFILANNQMTAQITISGKSRRGVGQVIIPVSLTGAPQRLAGTMSTDITAWQTDAEGHEYHDHMHSTISVSWVLDGQSPQMAHYRAASGTEQWSTDGWSTRTRKDGTESARCTWSQSATAPVDLGNPSEIRSYIEHEFAPTPGHAANWYTIQAFATGDNLAPVNVSCDDGTSWTEQKSPPGFSLSHDRLSTVPGSYSGTDTYTTGTDSSGTEVTDTWGVHPA